MTIFDAYALQARKGWTVFHVNSTNVQQAIDAVEAGSADGFFLSAGQGFQAKDFPKLCAAKNLKGIAAVTPGDVDWRLATERQDLLFLDLEYVSVEIDLSSQPQLESVSLLWNEKIHLPPADAALRRLILRGYAPKTEDFSELVGYSNLEYLSSTQGKLRSVNGASRLAK